MSQRTEQLSSLIHHNLNEIIVKEFEAPRDTMATITKVVVTPDLSWAFIHLSILPINKQGTVLKKIQHEVKHLQRKLNQTLHLRKFPTIKFKIDEQELYSRKVERALEE